MRQVYLEVKLRQAVALAGEGRKVEAEALAGVVRAARARLRLHEGRGEGVRRRAAVPVLQRRASGHAGPRRGRPRALEASRRRARLPTDGVRLPCRAAPRQGNDAEWRGRLETALAEADLYLFRGGHYPAVATCARGMLLLRLGRVSRAETKSCAEVFVLPDKGLPHHIARLALEESVEGGAPMEDPQRR